MNQSLQHFFKYSLLNLLLLAIVATVFLLTSCKKKPTQQNQTFTIQVDSLLLQSESLLFKDYGISLKNAQKALQLSKLSAYEKGIAEANRLIALVNNQTGKYNLAFTHIDTALRIAGSKNLDRTLAHSQQTKGFIYFTISKFDSAYFWYMKSLPYFEKVHIPNELSNIYSKIGRVYYNKREYNLALEYYQRALTITKSYGDNKSVARELNNIGSVYELQEKKEEAIIYFQEALNINLKANRKEWIAINYHNIAKIHSENNLFDTAKIYYEKALAIDKELGNNSYIAEDLYSLGIHYQNNGLHQQAIEYLKESEKLSIETNNLSTLIRIYDALSSSHKAIHEFENALENYKSYHTLSDSLFNSNSSRRIIEMELQYKYNLEQSQLAIKQQRNLILLLSAIGGLLFIAFVLSGLYARLKVKQKNSIIKRKVLESKLNENEAMLTANVMRLSERNKTLDLIIDELQSFSLHIRKKDQEELDKILSNIQKNKNENIWSEFDIRFKSVHGEFYQKLSQLHPDLSPNETRLCAFLKLNMSTKEIAQITHQSPKGINVARSRLRKKLNLTHTNKNIFEYLSEI